MQIHSTLLLLISFAFVFAPTLSQWLYEANTAWYRHHLVWLLIIVVIYLSLRQQRSDDL